MADYSVIVNSKYNPYSFDELLKPALMATQAHRELEDQYAELNTKASVWEKLANDARDKDSKAYETYKSYSNDLKAMADELASSGLNPSSRQKALNMKSRYSSDIIPIEEAYVKRAKLEEEQRKLQASKPYMMFDRYFSTDVGIDDLISNPALSYGSVSGEDIYNKGVNSAKAASLRRILSPETAKVLGDQYFELTERRGYTSAEAANFLANQNNIPELREAIKDILSQSNVESLNARDRQRAEDYAISGVMAGLTYDEGRKYLKNEAYVSPYEQWKNRGKGDSKLPGNLYFDELVGDVDVSKLDAMNLKGLKLDEKGNLTTDELKEYDKEIARLVEEVNKENKDVKYKGYEMSHKQIDVANRMRLFNARPKKSELQSRLSKYKEQLLNKDLTEKDRKNIEDRMFNTQYRIENYDNINAYLDSENEAERSLRALRYKRDYKFNELKNYAEQYSHLSDNPVEAALLGKAFNQQKSLREHSRFSVFNDDDTETFRKNFLSSIFNNAQISKTTGIYKDGKEEISLAELNELKENKNPIPAFDQDGLSLIDNKGNKYVVKTTSAQKQISKEITDIDKFMTDYSKKSINEAINSKSRGYLDLSNSGAQINEVNPLVLMRAIQSNGVTINETSGTKGMTIKNSDGTYYKVILYGSGNNPKLIISSVNDILNGGQGLNYGTNEYLRTRLSQERGDE